MTSSLVGLKYRDLTPEEQDAFGSKEAFKAARKEEKKGIYADAEDDAPVERFAGDAIFDITEGDAFKDDSERQAGAERIVAAETAKRDAGEEYNAERLEKNANLLNVFDSRAASQDQYDGSDIGTYDFNAFGVTDDLAGLKDVEYLAREGFSPEEISQRIDEAGVGTSKQAQNLLDKYIADIESGQIDPPEAEVPEAVVPETPSIQVPTIQPPSSSAGNNQTAVGMIGGDTGEITLTDSNNYGTINTGVINDIRNYGGGYGTGENSTGLVQAYVDSAYENFQNYSGPSYGMQITQSRQDVADDNNTIDTEGIYSGLNRFAQNFYDRGLLAQAHLYGDPYTFQTPNVQPFPALGS